VKPAERRKRLFKKSRPYIRPVVLMEGDQYGFDMGVLWAAYKAGSFPLVENRDMTADEFARYIIAHALTLSEMVIAEDDCKGFESGRGPVAVIGIRSDGWAVEPHVDFFAWATPRTILRVVVAFMQKMRYSKEVGVCVVRSLPDTNNLFRHVHRDYGVLHPVGMVAKGSPRGDVYLYSAWGAKDG
jgi:hypothetical protein